MNHEVQTPQVEKFRFRVGDLCYVLIGQIVNRDYQCFTFEWGTIVISSPVFERDLRDTVTKLWSTERPSQIVFESLMSDFCTRGLVQDVNSAVLNEWSIGSDIQVGSVQRLLQYYRNESVDVIARRVAGLNLSDRTVSTQITNGIDSYAIIDAIRPYPHPALAKSLQDQLEAGQDPELRASIVSVLKEWRENSIPR